jgi:signal transduction histidine kinase
VHRLNDLIKELLTLSRLETTQEEEWETIDLNRMLTTIIDDARFEAQNRDVAVEFCGLHRAEVRGSTSLLYRALENVVRNAIKYSDSNTAVEVTLQHDNSVTSPAGYLISVRDHGPGIPPSEMDMVLQPFMRSSEAKNTEGVGLGLAISDRILRQARGGMRLANASDGGLLVEIQLPRHSIH